GAARDRGRLPPWTETGPSDEDLRRQLLDPGGSARGARARGLRAGRDAARLRRDERRDAPVPALRARALRVVSRGGARRGPAAACLGLAGARRALGLAGPRARERGRARDAGGPLRLDADR